MRNLFDVWPSKRIIQRENMIRFLSGLAFISLLMAKDKFGVTGVVRNATGEGIKKVELSIFDMEGEEVKSSKSKKGGEFKFKKIEPGDYSLYGFHKKEGTGEIEFTIVESDLELELTIYLEAETEEDAAEEETVEISAEETIEEADKESVLLPQQREQPSKALLKFDETFFEYESNLKALKSEIDSLKSVVKGYEKSQTMPNLDRKILDLISVPAFHHRIELQNGTVVTGDILEESDSTLVLQTQIGKLVLKKEMVVRMEEFERPAPKVIFLGDPFIDYYPDRQIFSGRVKNVGEIRADFVRVIGNLFDQTTTNSGTDSIFVKGSRIVYDTNVIADTALEPGQTANYTLTIPIKKGRKVQYHTMDIHWDETQ